MTPQEELHEALVAAATRHGVPGAMAGVLVGGETVTASFGATNADHPLDTDDTTLFQVASITKTFVGAAMLLLVEQGLVDLDDPVAKHLPSLAGTTGLDLDRITVEHLLSHRAGFDGDHLFVNRTGESLDALRGARRLFEPGRGFSYNNAAFSIAGAVIAQCSGQPFETFMRRRLLRPLGMATACFRADDAITHRVAAPHLVHDGRAFVLRRAGWQPGWELGPVDRPAGGLVASVQHLLAWCRFQLDGKAADGSPVLQPHSLQRLHTPVVTADACDDVALDWFVKRSEGGTTIDHGGLTAGYCSDLVVAPDSGVGVVALTHATNGAAVNEEVRRWALERFAGIRERDPEPDPSLAVDAASFTGRFLSPFALLDVTAGERPGTLLVTASQRDDVEGWKPPVDPPTTFAFFRPDHAVSVDAAGPARIVRFGLEQRRASWLSWGHRRAPRVDS